MRLAGMIPPAVSPLTPNRTVDFGGVERLARRFVDTGASGVFVLGSCGEGPTLDLPVARDIVRAFVEAVDGAIPVLAGVGETSTERTVAAALDYEQLGVAALVVMAPMYFNAEPDGAVERHFDAVTARTSSPIVAYNIPHLTHMPISPLALARVAQMDDVVALKESSGEWEVYSPLAAVAKQNGLQVFQGAEALIARSLAAGADGAVPGVANLVPRLAVRLVEAGLAGDTPLLDRLQTELDEVCGIYGAGFWLSSLKFALAEIGLIGPTVGAALPALTEAEQKDLRARLSSIAADEEAAA